VSRRAVLLLAVAEAALFVLAAWVGLLGGPVRGLQGQLDPAACAAGSGPAAPDPWAAAAPAAAASRPTGELAAGALLTADESDPCGPSPNGSLRSCPGLFSPHAPPAPRRATVALVRGLGAGTMPLESVVDTRRAVFVAQLQSPIDYPTYPRITMFCGWDELASFEQELQHVIKGVDTDRDNGYRWSCANTPPGATCTAAASRYPVTTYRLHFSRDRDGRLHLVALVESGLAGTLPQSPTLDRAVAALLADLPPCPTDA
jgi:hypothetical protein